MNLILNGLSLFSGIGGLDVAFERAGGKVIGMCEKDPFCQKVLKKHWPDVPLYDDIFNLRGDNIESRVDIIYGGAPCQPFSVAGRQRGQSDERHLWPEFSRLVREIKPIWIVAENVLGIIRLAADDICQDLEHQGYSIGIWNYEAASIGALHRRSRVFFVAHSRCELHEGNMFRRSHEDSYTQKTTNHYQRSSEISRQTTTDYDSECCKEQQRPCTKQKELCNTRYDSGREFKSSVDRSIDGIPNRMDRDRRLITPQSIYPQAWLDGSWEDNIQRVATRIPNRVNRLKALGNAVVPEQAYPIFKAIMEVS